MKYFILLLGLQFFVFIGFSQEKKDTLTKTSVPQEARMLVSEKSTIKQKTPINKRVSVIDIISNEKANSTAKKTKNLKIEKE